MLISRNSVFLLAIIIAVVLCNCDSHITSSSCSSDDSCTWTQKLTCDYTQQCSLFNDQVSCLDQSISGMCQWNFAFGECNLQPTACQLSNEYQCNYPQSCVYSPPVQEACDADIANVADCFKKGNDEQTCQDAACLWKPSYFACATLDKCEKVGITNCDAQFCDPTVYSCSLTSNAETQCNSFTTQATCTQAGCVFSQTSKTCSTPTCSVVNNACNSPMCAPATGTCYTKSSTCSSKTQGSCEQDYCAWKEYQATCTYSCSIDDCKNKKQGCQNTAPANAECKPNLDSNQCQDQTQLECQSDALKNICIFEQGDSGVCSNVYKKCKKQAGVSCFQVQFCQQVIDHECVGDSKKSSANILQITISLIGLLVYIL